MTQSRNRYQETLAGINANSVKQADFSDLKLSEAGVRAIAEAVQQNTSLVAISFNHTRIGVEGVQRIVQAMEHHPSLWRVRFSFEDLKEISEELRKDLKDFSMENFKKFRSVRDEALPSTPSSTYSFGLFKPAVLLAVGVAATGLAVTAMNRMSPGK